MNPLLLPVAKTTDRVRAQRSRWTWAERPIGTFVLSPLGILNTLLGKVNLRLCVLFRDGSYEDQ